MQFHGFYILKSSKCIWSRHLQRGGLAAWGNLRREWHHRWTSSQVESTWQVSVSAVDRSFSWHFSEVTLRPCKWHPLWVSQASFDANRPSPGRSRDNLSHKNSFWRWHTSLWKSLYQAHSWSGSGSLRNDFPAGNWPFSLGGAKTIQVWLTTPVSRARQQSLDYLKCCRFRLWDRQCGIEAHQYANKII